MADSSSDLSSKDKLKELFRRYDVNGDGSICPQELRTCLQLVSSISDSGVALLFEQMDQNADGRIVVDEFVDWMFSTPASTSKAALELPAVPWGEEVLANGCVSASDVFGMLEQMGGAATDETFARLLESADSEGFLDASAVIKLSADGCLPAAFAGSFMTSSSSASGSGLKPVAAVARSDPASPAAADARGDEKGDDAEEEELCSVCHSEFWQKVVSPCSHSFCLECIKAWLCRKKTCPMCRADLARWNPRYDGPACTPAPPDHMMADKMHEERRREAAATARALSVEASRAARRAKAEQLMLRERERMRPEQDRIAALVPQGDAFFLRVGHRVRGSQAILKDEYGEMRYSTTFYVEAVQASLAIHNLIEQVRFETAGTHIDKPLDPRYGDWTHSQTCNGPKFERATFVQYSFKAHIIWREGMGMDALSLNIRCATSGSFTASRRVAVELPPISELSKTSKRIIATFRSEISRVSHRP